MNTEQKKTAIPGRFKRFVSLCRKYPGSLTFISCFFTYGIPTLIANSDKMGMVLFIPSSLLFFWGGMVYKDLIFWINKKER